MGLMMWVLPSEVETATIFNLRMAIKKRHQRRHPPINNHI